MKEDKELLERLDEVWSEEEREAKPKDNTELPISPYPLLLLTPPSPHWKELFIILPVFLSPKYAWFSPSSELPWVSGYFFLLLNYFLPYVMDTNINIS